MAAVTASDTHRAIDAVWRIESAKLIAGLARIVRDVGIAEDLAQDALVAALERWPESGVPDNPGAWLMATAKHRAIDLLRRNQRLDRKHEELGHELEAQQETAAPDLDAAIDDHVGDDLLRLMFTACHPVLSTEARAALTLRLLGGLTTDEIARAFLVPEPTVAQRIVRAKRTLAEAHVPFEVPRGAEFDARLASVLQSFTSCSTKDTPPRLVTIGCGRRYARMRCDWAVSSPSSYPTNQRCTALSPDGDPGVARTRAGWSIGGAGPVTRSEPRAVGSRLIRRGLAALDRAESLGGARGPYVLQAAIAACHARARTPGETDWPRIVALTMRSRSWHHRQLWS